MKKPHLKKVIRKHFKKWNIGDYIRQFSIVTGGVLLTLWLSARIGDASRQREVRQAMQLVALELRGNLQTIREYEWLYRDERRVALRLQENDFSLSGIPADTVELYWRRITNGKGRPYRFQTDALEMLKATGTVTHINDKELVIGLLRTYNELRSFDESMELFYDLRSETLIPHQMGKGNRPDETDLRLRFDRMLGDPAMQGWLAAIPRAFDRDFFIRYAGKLEAMISGLEKRCR